MSKIGVFKFLTTLFLEFKKIERNDETKYSIFYSNSKAKSIINESDIDNVFESICATIIWNVQKSITKGSSWIIDSVKGPITNISKYNLLTGSSYIILPK